MKFPQFLKKSSAISQFDLRIYSGLVAIAVGFVPIIFASFLALQKVTDDQKDFISTNGQELDLSEQLRYMDSAQSSLMPVFILTGENEVIKTFERRRQEFDLLAHKIEETEKDPEGLSLIRSILEHSHKLYALAGPGIHLRQKTVLP